MQSLDDISAFSDIYPSYPYVTILNFYGIRRIITIPSVGFINIKPS